MSADHGDRISDIEAGFAQLQATQDAQGREIGLIRNEVGNISRELRAGFAAQAADRTKDKQANIPAILSAAAVIIALGALVSGNLYKGLEQQGASLRLEMELSGDATDERLKSIEREVFKEY